MVFRRHPSLVGSVLVTGFNFGTGSSREQAATALKHGSKPILLVLFEQMVYCRLCSGYPVGDLWQRQRNLQAQRLEQWAIGSGAAQACAVLQGQLACMRATLLSNKLMACYSGG